MVASRTSSLLRAIFLCLVVSFTVTGCFALFDFESGSSGTDGPNPTGDRNGTACTEGSSCRSGHCVDGVCCDSACDGACNACTAALTGKSDGDCVAVTNDTDPDGDCEPSNPSTCGQTGTCANGACQQHGVDVLCAAASCSDGVKTLARTCSGLGECQPAQTRNCECNGPVCEGECANDEGCTPVEFCNLITNECEPKLVDGQDCPGNSACASKFCVDGICCNDACTSPCNSCKKSHTGENSGLCSAIEAGKDPNNDCSPTNPPCGETGTCNGLGSCAFGATDIECGTGTCANDVATEPAMCSGTGSCTPGSVTPCGAYTCNGNVCGTTCSHCASGAVCKNGGCTFSMGTPNGTSCSLATTCESGHCIDGVCCDQPCTGRCEGCVIAKTQVASGTCAAIPSGSDPDNECNVMPCIEGNSCDGMRACQGSNTCPNGVCAGTVCKLNNGQGCSVGDVCNSGFCSDGVCCDTPCDGICEVCSLGICTDIQSDVDNCQPFDTCCLAGNCCGGLCLIAQSCGM